MLRTVALLLCAATLLAACGEKPASENTVAAPHDHAHAENAGEHPANHDKAPRHGSSDEPEFRWDHIKAPAPGHETIDLKNEKDPVSLKPVSSVTAEYKGYLVHFESEATRARFERKPIKYLNMLSLEPRVDGGVFLVDASTYKDAVTEFCPFMPESEVDPHGTVYLLHRGWKIFFCCWTGCGDYFLQDPAKAYDWYGLVERDGKLVRKADE
jgi:YHS domain-containing protein